VIHNRIFGTWRLRSGKAVDDEGKSLEPPYGPTPNGVLCFEPDGRMFCVMCDGRTELPQGEPRQFMSYAGNYVFDGSTISTRVDASSDPARIGTDQVRQVRFVEGGIVLAPPRRLWAGAMQRHELFWERIG